MFEDQDKEQKEKKKFSNSDNEKLNNKLVQPEDEKKQTYQDKLRNSEMAEDIFSDTDKTLNKNDKIIKASDLDDKDKISLVKPLTNYQDLLEESDNIKEDKIKPRYFIIGLLIVLILVFSLGFLVYKKFLTGEKNSGEVILNTEPEEIDLQVEENEEIVEPGVEINSSAVSDDIDGDGLSNEEEEVLKTDPKKSDTDEDGLSDREEVKIYHTDPLDPDTDEDTYLDGEEIENGYNPLGEGKLFDFSLITGEENVSPNNTVKELVEPDIDISNWSSFENKSGNLSFKYPYDWSINQEDNRIIISPNDTNIKDYIEIEIRDNILELDLIDWLNTQVDYPDFRQDKLKINEYLALVVHSDNPDWDPLSSIFINKDKLVYNFKFFSTVNDSNNFDVFQKIVLSTNLD